MKTQFRTFFAGGAAALTVAVSTLPISASAQAPSPGHSVLIVVPDTFKTANARAVIFRNAQQEDIIALNGTNLTADEVVAAMSLLQQARGVVLPSGVATGAIVLTGAVPVSTSDPEKVHKAAALLGELLGRGSVSVGNLGRGRWLRLAELRL